MDLGPELNDKWLALASEALLPPSRPSAVRPREAATCRIITMAHQLHATRQSSEAEPVSAAGSAIGESRAGGPGCGEDRHALALAPLTRRVTPAQTRQELVQGGATQTRRGNSTSLDVP
jgi:hypothetical protein